VSEVYSKKGGNEEREKGKGRGKINNLFLDGDTNKGDNNTVNETTRRENGMSASE
jgi:hypothetical protein